MVVVAEGFCVAIAQLASRSRLGEENRRCEEALARSREANDEAEERNRAAEARERQAEAIKRQGQGIALLRSAALLSARLHCLSGPASWLLFWGGVPYWCVIAIKTHLVYQSLIT